ncbi:MAG: polyether ionophore transport system ATP-binding protein [Microbacteriaceae bacterium]|nr:polyether ionophore transport system ATP-binding protein [Microbacteriaceae bacterium]
MTTAAAVKTVIETRGLEKQFGSVRALDGLDLAVSAGEVHGFLGPNGAGKSTTIRILLGLARASGGTATVFGDDPWNAASALHARIAYVPGDVALWPNLSGGEAIDLIARLRGNDTRNAEYTTRRRELSEAFQFDPTRKARAYSKGNRQKVALIAALATPADLYILDEPTSGLDPVMEAVFSREISRLVAAGATVLLSSHILSEVERLCDRVSIIRAGKTVETGTLAEMRHLTRTEISFAVDGRSDTQVATIPAVHDVVVADGRVTFTVDSDAINSLLPRLASLGVQGLTIAPPSLEELFLRHYGDDIRGSESSLEKAAAR